MRPLSQVDPWNGCDVCRELFGRGIVPEHNWTHELRMWWNDEVPAWAYGTDPKHEPPESFAVGVSGSAIGLFGIALASLAGELRKEEATDAK